MAIRAVASVKGEARRLMKAIVVVSHSEPNAGETRSGYVRAALTKPLNTHNLIIVHRKWDGSTCVRAPWVKY